MNRRDAIKLLGLGALHTVWPSLPSWASQTQILTKTIPSSGEKIPVIGMGTWITFNVGSSQKLRDARTQVLGEFFKRGGTFIDSSPMYGSAEEVVGYALKKLNKRKQAFAATKIWTSSAEEGPEQFKNSQRLWGLNTIELEQVHNLRNWRSHLKLLRKLKEEGKIRYLGITTSHGRRHDELLSLLKLEKLDFVQLTYNVTHREAEGKLLDTAKSRGVAVIANRPLDGGNLMEQVQRHPLPPWAKEAGFGNWAEYLLKYVVSHPAITVAIPATSQLVHMKENMGAGYGTLPEAKLRDKMAAHVRSL